jgi:hypothetical protein
MQPANGTAGFGTGSGSFDSAGSAFGASTTLTPSNESTAIVIQMMYWLGIICRYFLWLFLLYYIYLFVFFGYMFTCFRVVTRL